MIFLVRHGQTEWNVEKRMQGFLDSPLTSIGMNQAKGNGQLLKSLLPENSNYGIVCSPLGRTVSTTKIICGELAYDFNQVMTDDILKEANFGKWGGLTELEVAQKFPGQLNERKCDHWNHRIPQGESYVDLSKRAASFFDAYGSSSSIRIVVTHEMMSRSIRGYYLGLDPKSTLQLTHPQNQIFVLNDGEVIEYQA